MHIYAERHVCILLGVLSLSQSAIALSGRWIGSTRRAFAMNAARRIYSFIQHIICACTLYTRGACLCDMMRGMRINCLLCERALMAPKRLPSGRGQVREILERNIMGSALTSSLGYGVHCDCIKPRYSSTLHSYHICLGQTLPRPRTLNSNIQLRIFPDLIHFYNISLWY